MTSWEFNLPVTLEFGVGKRKEIKSYIDSIGGKNGVLVCSHSFSKNGVADEFVKMSEGTLKAVFADIRPNPTTDNVNNCVKVMRKIGADFCRCARRWLTHGLLQSSLCNSKG